MYEIFFADNAVWFTVPAVLGTVFFAGRLALMFMGVSHDLPGVDAVDVHHGDSSEAFKALSVQGIAAFFMGFGWGGLGGLKGTEWGWTGAMLSALIGGVAMVWLLGLLLKAVYDLQSSGNFKIENAIGVEGSVYANIPGHGEGRGQVKIVIDDRQRIFNAVSEGESLPSNTNVRIVKVNDDNTLTVIRA
jgi:membrane protein implicated in regulation of membrane protease activity